MMNEHLCACTSKCMNCSGSVWLWVGSHHFSVLSESSCTLLASKRVSMNSACEYFCHLSLLDRFGGWRGEAFCRHSEGTQEEVCCFLYYFEVLSTLFSVIVWLLRCEVCCFDDHDMWCLSSSPGCHTGLLVLVLCGVSCVSSSVL